MKTQNIISTPDITGNIGSCTTQTQQVIVHSGIWRDVGYTLATNSCNGQVEKYDYNSLNAASTLFSIAFLIFVLFASLGVCISIATKNSDE